MIVVLVNLKNSEVLPESEEVLSTTSWAFSGSFKKKFSVICWLH